MNQKSSVRANPRSVSWVLMPDNLCSGHFANKTTPAGWQLALRANFLQGHEWVTKGNAPPTSTRLATVGGDAEIARDSKGNALLVEITGASSIVQSWLPG